ncbi:MAG: phosphate regulon sensor histidine kinase PhoR [Planctomycetes bacterium]|nr:phosphate regulon sensor histidine kinase PhoR [Planctomycetota bacterium]
MKRRLLWQIFPAFLVITALGLFLIFWNVSALMKDFYYQEKRVQLEKLGNLSVSSFPPLLEQARYAQIQALCKTMGQTTQTRFTVIDPQGKVLGDSQEQPEKMVTHFDRPEFQTALAGQVGSDIRPSETLQQEMMYVAIPIQQDGAVVAVLRTSVAMTELQATLHSVFREVLHYGLIIALVLAILSLGFSWKISRPLELLRLGADRFARGDLNHRLAIPKSHEIAGLADSMNKMAVQLDERIRMIVAQKNEQQAVLSSMIEGVIAVSTNGKVMSLNSAAAAMLQETVENAEGRTIEEVIRNTELQPFVQQALDSEEPVESQIMLHEKSQREQYLQSHGTMLTDDQGRKIGALIVMNDITRIRRLEQVRRDFVANVSHELKTPVTSIKGFIETLLDGAINKPDDAQRFLEIIARQTERLNSIIDDLLTLSRIEQQSGGQMATETVPLKPVLAAAVDLCQIKAVKKNMSIHIDCDETVTVQANASLLEQAMVNLVDNAIKYSEPGGDVRLDVRHVGEEIQIHVHDHGCGIAKEHLPRLFERFYRVDKARSRKLGGTGLGLAIVNHIAQSHKGRVYVESVIGKGSTFTFCLPA